MALAAGGRTVDTFTSKHLSGTAEATPIGGTATEERIQSVIDGYNPASVELHLNSEFLKFVYRNGDGNDGESAKKNYSGDSTINF